MPEETDNHNYGKPLEGELDWGSILNNTLDDLDDDVPIRDIESNRSNYTPVEDATFHATDTGAVYKGDGTNWVLQDGKFDAVDANSANVDSVSTERATTTKAKSLSNGKDLDQFSGFGIASTSRPFLVNPNEESYTYGLEQSSLKFYSDIFSANRVEPVLFNGSSYPNASTQSGIYQTTNGEGGTRGRYEKTRSSPKFPNFLVVGRVSSYSASAGGTTNANPRIGIGQDADNYIHLEASLPDDTCKFHVTNSGNTTTSTASTTGLPSPPYWLCAFFAGGEVLGFVYDGESWDYWLEAAVSSPDLYNQSTLSEYEVAVGSLTDDGASVDISEVAGPIYTGGVGLVNPYVVRYREGKQPVVKDGKIFVVATAGSKNQFGFMHTCVLSVDLESYEVDLTGVIGFETEAGQVYTDVASQILLDQETQEWIVATSGYCSKLEGPDSRTYNYVGRTDSNPLYGVNIVSASKMNLPAGDSGASNLVYDPAIHYNADDGVWRCVYNADNIYEIAVASTTDPSLQSGWTKEYSYVDSNGLIEGARIPYVNGNHWITFANSDASNSATVASYPDISTGQSDIALGFNPTGSLNPHPEVVALPDDDKCRYLLLSMISEPISFNGSSWGKESAGTLGIWEGTHTATGYETDLIDVDFPLS